MNIYKLKYLDKETAVADLIAKGVLVEVTNVNNDVILSNATGVHAVVDIGTIVLTQGTYDENFVEVTAPVYANGYHYDVMCEQTIDFGTARLTPTNSVHSFLGFNPNDYNIINQNTNTNENILI